MSEDIEKSTQDALAAIMKTVRQHAGQNWNHQPGEDREYTYGLVEDTVAQCLESRDEEIAALRTQVAELESLLSSAESIPVGYMWLPSGWALEVCVKHDDNEHVWTITMGPEVLTCSYFPMTPCRADRCAFKPTYHASDDEIVEFDNWQDALKLAREVLEADNV